MPMDHAQLLLHRLSPQQPSVLTWPFAAWSIFDFGMVSLIILSFHIICTCLVFTFTTSMDLSIQMTAQANTQAILLGSAFSSLTFAQTLGEISPSLTSGALFSGPLSLLSARLHMANFLSNISSHRWPSSIWAHFASARYWSEAWSFASSRMAAISTKVSVDTGAIGYPHWLAICSILFLFVDFDAHVPAAKNFLVNSSLTLFLHPLLAALSIAVSSAFLLAPLDLLPRPFSSWPLLSRLACLLKILLLTRLGLS